MAFDVVGKACCSGARNAALTAACGKEVAMDASDLSFHAVQATQHGPFTRRRFVFRRTLLTLPARRRCRVGRFHSFGGLRCRGSWSPTDSIVLKGVRTPFAQSMWQLLNRDHRRGRSAAPTENTIVT